MHLWKKLALRYPFIYKLAMILGVRRNYAILTFLEQIRRGDVVFDIGANRGAFAAVFSMLVGKEGQVHCFEPVSENFAHLIHLQSNHPNIKLYNWIISERRGKTEIFIPSNDTAQSSLKNLNWGNWKTADSILRESRRCESLDHFMDTRQADSPSFIKIDTEGSELLVLKGAKKILSERHPKVYIELNPHTLSGFGYKPSDVHKQLRKFGYNSFTLVTGKGIIPNVEDVDAACQAHFSPDLLSWVQ